MERSLVSTLIGSKVRFGWGNNDDKRTMMVLYRSPEY